MLYPVSLVYLVTDMTSQVPNLLNISNMELELIKQNVDWYIANCFKFKAVNICLQSCFYLLGCHQAFQLSGNTSCASCDQSVTVLWGEVVGCIVLGLCPACQITIQSTVFPEVAVMSALDGSQRQHRYFSTVPFSGLYVFGSCTQMSLECLDSCISHSGSKSNFLLAFWEGRWGVNSRYNPVHSGFAHT